jgi:hypothetical protein
MQTPFAWVAFGPVLAGWPAGAAESGSICDVSHVRLLRTGGSPPAALHLVLPRGSSLRLQAGERSAWGDLHLAMWTPSQAHECTAMTVSIAHRPTEPVELRTLSKLRGKASARRHRQPRTPCPIRHARCSDPPPAMWVQGRKRAAEVGCGDDTGQLSVVTAVDFGLEQFTWRGHCCPIGFNESGTTGLLIGAA